MTEALDLASATEGAPIEIVGAVLSSMKVVDGPAAPALFAEASTAVPAAIEIPTVPSPEHEDRVTVRVLVPAPLTAAEQLAVPVVLTVTSPLAKVIDEAPVYVIVYVTEALDLALVAEGAPMASVGAVLSTLNVVDGPALAEVFPAASEAVADASEIPIVPSPVQDDKETVRVEVPVPETATEQSAVPVLLRVTSPTAAVTLVAPV